MAPRFIMEDGKDNSVHDPAATISRMPLTRTPSMPYREAETETDRFRKALVELKDLRSQLHHAADYCENAFLKNDQKKLILESTKNYICEAIVAVVDHLGNVSSKLEQRLDDNTEIVETERRIDGLRQRLLTCQQYAISLELSSVQWRAKFPRLHKYYVSPMNQHTGKSDYHPRNGEPEETPSKNYGLGEMVHPPVSVPGVSVKSTKMPINSGSDLAKAVPVLERSSFLPKSCNLSLGLGPKYEDVYLVGGGEQKKKPVLNNFFSFLKASRGRTATKLGGLI